MKDLVDLVVVLDESGSMSSVKKDTVGGFNTFLETHQSLPGKARLTLVKFNTSFGVAYDGIDVKEIKPLDDRSYLPGGGTALLDAVGKTIDLVLKRINASKDEDVPDKVILCIQTDGEENSSHEYTLDQIKNSIENMRINNGWQILFIGADQDAWNAGSSLGSNQNVNYNSANTVQAFHGLSHFTASTRSFASSPSVSQAYVDAGINTNSRDYDYQTSFSMSTTDLDTELEKFKNVKIDASAKSTKTKKSKAKSKSKTS
jgi:uncharacterized protein YegL